MSDSTSTIPNHQAESNRHGDIVVNLDSNPGSVGVKDASVECGKPEIPAKVATTSEDGSEGRRLAEEQNDSIEPSFGPPELSLKDPTVDSGSKTSYLLSTKPVSSRRANATIDNTITNADSDTRVQSFKNDASGVSSSLLHRLAGPSVGKAGLARDQTEITRLIAKASEGSKYYENEKRKNEEVEKKVEGLLKLRDGLRTMADIPRLEAVADKMIAELEDTRDLSQMIVHVDMDSFYASIEVLRDSTLANKPFGVGSNNGVLSTASYAARAFGVRSGMATYIARALCPSLIVVHMDWERIGKASESVMDVLREYAGDPEGGDGCGMDVAGVDEAYVNITGYCKAHEIDAEECVKRIRTQIFEETKLTASAGIAPNKMLAKICSEKNKPNGQYALTFEADAIKEFMQTLPIRRIPGVGRVTERLLAAVGIETCGDIYTHRATLALLDKHLHMHEKLAIYLGLGSNQIRPWARESRKSVGAERTFRAIEDPAKIQEKLELVARELETDLERLGFAGHTITLKVKLDTFELRSRAKSAHKPVRKYEELLTIGQELLAHELPLKLRLLGLRVTNLKDLRAPETGIKRFFGNAEEGAARPTKRRKLEGPDGTGNNAPAEEPIYIVDDDSEDDGATSNLKRAATATPEKLRKEPLSDVTIFQRASSHEPIGSQDAFADTTSRPLVKRKRSPQGLPLPPSKGEQKSDITVEGKGKGTAQSPSNVLNEQHVCPICSKTLQTDNSGLNAHIDWCLSRSAILEASASGSSDVAGPLAPAKKGTGTKKIASTTSKPGSSKGPSKNGKQDIRLAWKVSS